MLQHWGECLGEVTTALFRVQGFRLPGAHGVVEKTAAFCFYCLGLSV